MANLKPGDRVRYPGRWAECKTGIVEFADKFGTVCNVAWDDQSRSMVKVRVLEKVEICAKINDCHKVQMVLDKDYDAEGLYGIVIREVCAICQEKGEKNEMGKRP